MTAISTPMIAIAVDQWRDEVAGEVESLGVAFAGDVTVGVDVRPGHHVAGPDDLADEAVLAVERRHLDDAGIGQPCPGRHLEAVLAQEPDGGRIDSESPLRLVHDHPDQLRAIVRRGEAADDAEDAVERFGELGFDGV